VIDVFELVDDQPVTAPVEVFYVQAVLPEYLTDLGPKIFNEDDFAVAIVHEALRRNATWIAVPAESEYRQLPQTYAGEDGSRPVRHRRSCRVAFGADVRPQP
jgi:hypothetical protein